MSEFVEEGWENIRLIPESVAVCPICGKRLWIECIEEVSQESDDAPWLPESISLSCEDEPDIGSKGWCEWHQWHFATPYIDWLPVEVLVLRWLRQPGQQELVSRLRGF